MKNASAREQWVVIPVNTNAEPFTLDGNWPWMAKGAQSIWRIALFDRVPVNEDDPGEFRNHALLALATLKIRSVGTAPNYYAGTLLLNSDSIAGSVVFDAACTEEQFWNRERAPITITIPGANTSIAPENQYFTLTGLTSDSAEVKDWAKGRVTVEDIGIGLADSAVPANPTSPTTEQVTALINQCVKYGKNPAGKTLTLVSPDGFSGITKGCANTGDEMGNQETYP